MLEYTDKGIIYKFTIEFVDNIPRIEDLKIYCTKHQSSSKVGFVELRCPIPNCENSRQSLDEERLIDLLESHLLDAWEKS